jgi:hypothetical protein
MFLKTLNISNNPYIGCQSVAVLIDAVPSTSLEYIYIGSDNEKNPPTRIPTRGSNDESLDYSEQELEPADLMLIAAFVIKNSEHAQTLILDRNQGMTGTSRNSGVR